MSLLQVSWPLDVLQRLFGPIGPGKLVLIGSRPGTGKGVMALQMASHNAARMPVLYLDTRPNRALMNAYDDWCAQLRAEGVSAHAFEQLTLDEVERMVGEHVRAYGPGLVVINTLQEMTHDCDPSEEDEHPTLSYISMRLKTLAITHRIAIVCASQLEAEADREPGRRPKLYHLRGSGALEGDADQVYFLWRDGSLKIAQEKHRTGRPQSTAIDLDYDLSARVLKAR